MALPPAFVQGGPLHCAAETFEEEVKKAQREFSARLAVGRCREPQARQMGQMTAGRVAMENLQQKELHGGDWREHTVSPRRIPHLATQRENGVGLQQRGPLACKPVKDGGDARDHGVTSWTVRVFDAYPYRRCVENLNVHETPWKRA
jgi:hypothetical protein